jgi:beta-lactam-binding protein with PASTA domain
MKYELNGEVILNLKQKIDALIEKGNELSINLTVDEKYIIMKKVIGEGIDKAIQNIYKDEEIYFTEREFKEKKKNLKKIVQEYFDKKFSECIAQDWLENR